MKKIKFRTDFLYSSPDFLTGVGSLMNIQGNYFEFNASKSGEDADFKALISDWGVVGNDISEAAKSLSDDLSKKRGSQLELELGE